MRLVTPFDDFTMPIPFCGCKIWMGGLVDNRYGAYWDGVKQHRAHVYSYERKHGKVPEGKIVCHTCDTTVCVEENHLYAGTHQSNMDDKVNKERQARLFGKDNGSTKLSTEAVAYIQNSDLSTYVLADMFGVSQSHASRVKRSIRSGRTRK